MNQDFKENESIWVLTLKDGVEQIYLIMKDAYYKKEWLKNMSI